MKTNVYLVITNAGRELVYEKNGKAIWFDTNSEGYIEIGNFKINLYGENVVKELKNAYAKSFDLYDFGDCLIQLNKKMINFDDYINRDTEVIEIANFSR